MTAFIITIAAGFVLSAMWIVVMAMNAPEGFENSDGFHFGRKSDDLDSEG